MKKLLTAGLVAALSILLSAASADPLAPTGRWSACTAGRAATPPMGWSTWNAFATDIDEDKIIGSAQQIVDSGLAAKGYRYINIDDGWALKRRMPRRAYDHPRRQVSLVARGRRHSQLQAIHRYGSTRWGLKAGIYSTWAGIPARKPIRRPKTICPRETSWNAKSGLYGRIDQDIALYFAKWGFDFIKVDSCGLRDYAAGKRAGSVGQVPGAGALPGFRRGHADRYSGNPGVVFRQINLALARENPDGDYLLSLCFWGAANVRAWGKDYGGISRTSDDISPAWGRLLVNYDTTVTRSLYAHPGSWNDPDMLHIGAGDFDADHLTEARSHFALWAMLKAPLMIGTDLRKTPKALARHLRQCRHHRRRSGSRRQSGNAHL